jgi:aconitate hydratase
MTSNGLRSARTNSFGARSRLAVGDRTFEIHRLDSLGPDVASLPYSIKVLLENLLRNENGVDVRAEDVAALATWPSQSSDREISFMPARVLMQDFTGVPAVVDLAAMRDGVEALGGDPARIDPLIPAELVIDHSLSVEVFGVPEAFH